MKVAVSRLDDANAYLHDWRDLLKRGAPHSYFHSAPWVESWIAGAPPNGAIYRVDGFADNNRLLLCSLSVCSSLGIRGASAYFNEFGDDALDLVYTEYNDFLLLNTPDPDAARSIALREIFAALPEVETFVFRNIKEVVRTALIADAKSLNFSVREVQESPVYACSLQQSTPFIDSLSKSLRTKIRRSIRRYEERGPVTLTLATSDDDKKAAWNLLSELHEAAWRSRGVEGAFSTPYFAIFHERLRTAAPSSIELLQLKAGEQVLGVLYNFLHGDEAMSYQSGFHFENDNQLVPGFVAHMLAAERYREKGLRQYNLLAGEADYKKRLGEKIESFYTIAVDRPTMRNRLLTAARQIKSRLRS